MPISNRLLRLAATLAVATLSAALGDLSPESCDIRAICYALDQSGSISDAHYKVLQQFTVRTARGFDKLGDPRVRTKYAAVAFSFESVLIAPPTEELERVFVPAIQGPERLRSSTNIYAGLMDCYEILEAQEAGARALILITDGHHNRGGVNPIDEIKRDNIAVVSVGVGNAINATALSAWATKPRFFVPASFDNLATLGIDVVQAACDAVDIIKEEQSPEPTQTTNLSTPISNSTSPTSPDSPWNISPEPTELDLTPEPSELPETPEPSLDYETPEPDLTSIPSFLTPTMETVPPSSNPTIPQTSTATPQSIRSPGISGSASPRNTHSREDSTPSPKSDVPSTPRPSNLASNTPQESITPPATRTPPPSWKEKSPLEVVDEEPTEPLEEEPESPTTSPTEISGTTVTDGYKTILVPTTTAVPTTILIATTYPTQVPIRVPRASATPTPTETPVTTEVLSGIIQLDTTKTPSSAVTPSNETVPIASIAPSMTCVCIH